MMTSLLLVILALYVIYSSVYAACNVCVVLEAFLSKIQFFISLNITFEAMYMQINLKQETK